MKVIDEQGERVFLGRKNLDEVVEHEVEAVLRLIWAEFRQRRLWADDQLDFRNDVDKDSPVRAER